MNRKIRNVRKSALVALCCAAVGVGLVGCEDEPKADKKPAASSTGDGAKDGAAKGDGAEDEGAKADDAAAFTGTKKIKVDGRTVNVSCSGKAAEGKPVVMLLHGGGDDVTKLAGLQKSVSGKDRVCSYDRLGAGASDKPEGLQTVEDAGKVLTGVLDQVAGESPVVLAGHSLGGLFAGRYAPDHQDRIKGLVLMDATSPTQGADLKKLIPADADKASAELRDQTLMVLQGKGPEKLVTPDGPVRSAGDIPVEVIQHGKQYLGAVPKYGKGLERAWTQGQHEWLKLSSNSKLSVAKNSEHYIYVDEPDVAVAAIQQVVQGATG
ncbi:4,5:9,10-diseco-3-hydroxy-5,9,17-trioxoandrosta-1(10),2-diene-4-oate hydrolase [Streptomyces sp. YIM 130001]|uniref:alpha/beta fold hydrolase n=1 Tax=Streptomyces sp. YIM 130001 TaxID=2259644 RepID=UPI000E64F2E6|nr:alpha/beta fold hydrolase [Streptomyces sp. YIM 130001]RII11689.1 4,5:9,10-diseco-3-hydroxy-5,9,17-trioxoandrosta-1(10),2-diene-4-oate hydrolase [Streptomyces sp. YIM 130001]